MWLINFIFIACRRLILNVLSSWPQLYKEGDGFRREKIVIHVTVFVVVDPAVPAMLLSQGEFGFLTSEEYTLHCGRQEKNERGYEN